MATTLTISLKLERFNETSSLFLKCSLRESWNTRDWESYGLNPQSSKKVCSADEAINIVWPCVQDCVWYPETFKEFLVCLGHDGRRHTYAPSHQDRINANPCDCPCDKFVTVERPSVVVMTLAFVAQSAVTSTLALTLVLSIRTTKVHLRRVVSLVFSIMVKRRSNQNLSNGGAVLSPKKRFEEDDYSREFSEWNGRAVDFRLQILGSIAPTDIKNSTRDPCPTSKQYESPGITSDSISHSAAD